MIKVSHLVPPIDITVDAPVCHRLKEPLRRAHLTTHLSSDFKVSLEKDNLLCIVVASLYVPSIGFLSVLSWYCFLKKTEIYFQKEEKSVNFYLRAMFEEVHHVFIDTEGFAASSSASHLQYTVILPWKIIQIAAHRCTFWSQKI